jgi:O-antigen ligase
MCWRCGGGTPLARPSKKPGSPLPVAVPRERLLDRVACWLAIACAGLVPLLVTPSAYDPYRLPKEMLLRAFGIAIIAVLAMRLVVNGWPRVKRPIDVAYLFLAGTLLWTLISTLFSRNRRISVSSVIDVLAYAAVVFTIYALARRRWRVVLHVVLAAAFLNALSCVLARFGPTGFLFAQMQGRSIGLLGSANDIGGYLSFVIIVALGMAVSDRRRRWLYSALAVVLMAGLLATQTLGAVVATVAGAMTMTLIAFRRRAPLMLAGLFIAATAAVMIYQPLLTRAVRATVSAGSGEIDSLLPGRATPFLSAWEMAMDRPLTGVGPGCFGFEYFPYKQRVEKDHPSLNLSPFRMENFADVHNDHLQTLAQTGIPGYLLLLAVLVWLGSVSVRRPASDDTPERFARVTSLPLAVCFFVVTLPEFVLELAAPTITVLVAATICLMFRGERATA